MITIVNYGMGNLGSVHNMLKRIGVEAMVTSDLDEIAKASKLILPGVGAFDKAMECINEGGFLEVLNDKALVERVPLLGICLGMQLLTNVSEEGSLPGLGWIDAKVTRFPSDMNLKIPHMGWNIVSPCQKSALISEMPDESRFYFVHSYCVHAKREEEVLLRSNYGISFDAAIQRRNIFGVQFHPEKSHKFGMKLLKNFAEL